MLIFQGVLITGFAKRLLMLAGTVTFQASNLPPRAWRKVVGKLVVENPNPFETYAEVKLGIFPRDENNIVFETTT